MMTNGACGCACVVEAIIIDTVGPSSEEVHWGRVFQAYNGDSKSYDGEPFGEIQMPHRQCGGLISEAACFSGPKLGQK